MKFHCPTYSTKEILDKVVEFCTHHVSDPIAEIDSNVMTYVVSEWEANFIDVEHFQLF